MPLCPAGLKLCEQSGFLGEIYFLCQLQAASAAERMSLSLRGHRSLLQPALSFYFISEGIRTIKEIQADIWPSPAREHTRVCTHTLTSTRATCSSRAQPTPQPQNPTRNPQLEPGG